MRPREEIEPSDSLAHSASGLARELDVSEFPPMIGGLARGGGLGEEFVMVVPSQWSAEAPKLYRKTKVKSCDFGEDIDDWTESEDAETGSTHVTNDGKSSQRIVIEFKDGKKQYHNIQPHGSVTIEEDGTYVIIEGAKPDKAK